MWAEEGSRPGMRPESREKATPRVLLLSRYGSLGASSRLRMYQYLPFLREAGFLIDVAPLLDDAYLQTLYTERRRELWKVASATLARVTRLLSARKYDLIWLEKEALPGMPALAERLLVASGTPYVVDYDDAVFHNYDRSPSWLTRRFLGQKIDVVMRHAAMVAVGNGYLGERARQAGARRIEMIPTVIDVDRYSADPLESSDVGFTLGWIGSPSTQQYLEPLREVWAALATNAERGRLVTVGAQSAFAQELGSEAWTWSEDTEVRSIRHFDVGVMPLPDEPWERGKCGYKLIQYMACAKPVIASPVGVNRDIVEHGVNGLLADSKDEWAAAVAKLRSDPALRKKMGEAGRSKVERRYTMQVIAPRLETLLRGAAGDERGGRVALG